MAFKSTCKTLAKVADDEPIFVLRAQDRLAADTVAHWAWLAKGVVSREKYDEAMRCAEAMRTWKDRKLPD